MSGTLQVLAGMVSTAIAAGSLLPMLLNAASTHDLSSYSQGYIALANIGNALHSVYVLHLPPGPIRLLHLFSVISSAPMLLVSALSPPRGRRPRWPRINCAVGRDR